MTKTESNVRVILVDDHEVVRRGIREFLTEAGIEVIAEASSGQEALPLITELKPDVVLLDIRMQEQSGIDLANHIRELELPVGILILSAYDDDPFVMAAIESGVNGYVLKTAKPQEIINAVRAVHEGKSVLAPAILNKVLNAISTPRTEELYEIPSDRELEVLYLAAQGLTNKAIGYKLGISDRTVQGHMSSIFEKLRVGNRTEAVVRAAQLGWVDLPD